MTSFDDRALVLHCRAPFLVYSAVEAGLNIISVLTVGLAYNNNNFENVCKVRNVD